MSLAQEAEQYMKQLEDGEAEGYLLGRGLFIETITDYQLGYIAEPLSPEAEAYVGCITIPYFGEGKSGRNVYQLRTRSLEGKQYKWWPRHEYPLPFPKVHIYNAQVLQSATEVVITEGEFDCLTLQQLDIPAIGLPGVNSFQDSWAYLLEDKRVLIAFDGDKAGRDAARALQDKLEEYRVTARIVDMPDGKDINELYTSHGELNVREILGMDLTAAA